MQKECVLGLTGAQRLRTYNRFFGKDLVVLQVQEKVLLQDVHPTGSVAEIEYQRWRDATAADAARFHEITMGMTL